MKWKKSLRINRYPREIHTRPSEESRFSARKIEKHRHPEEKLLSFPAVKIRSGWRFSSEMALLPSPQKIFSVLLDFKA